MEDALAAGDALFRPGGPLLDDGDEGRVEARVDRLVVPLGDGLDPGAAAQGQDDIISLDRIGGRLDEDVPGLAVENVKALKSRFTVLIDTSYP